MRTPTLLAAAVLIALAGCSDTQPTEVGGRQATRQVIAPNGSLDQNIASLLDMLPRGVATAGRNRWGSVKTKYQAGLTDPAQMKVAKKMLFELAQWVKAKAPEMDPPGDETSTAAAARLTLYMSQYVYEGPEAEPPAYVAGADNAVALVTPTDSATVVTPAEQAGVSLEAGSVDEETIIVITENPTPYPANCSGPLQTKLCQYPRFYHFNQFPHERLQKAARFSVCHVNDGTQRLPLADHDRFRLAHTLPANPADYTPGSTIRDQNGEAIEILPLVTQTFIMCGETEYSRNEPHGLGGLMTRLARNVGKLVSPKNAYAIDQGAGGESFMFSDFNDVDPDGVPDNSLDTLAVSSDTTHPGDHVTLTYTVSNSGTATSPTVPAVISFNTSVPSPTVQILTSVPVPALVPGQTVTIASEVVVPVSAMPGGSYTIGLSLGNEPTFPEVNTGNNALARPIAVDPTFLSAAPRFNVNEGTGCALSSSSQVSCWGQNNFWQMGQSGPDQAQPFAPTALPSTFVELTSGIGQTSCGIKADRSALCWGRGQWGQLGNGFRGPNTSGPVNVTGGISWASISNGHLDMCGVSTSGVGYCWGSNQRGEIGRVSKPTGTDTSSMTYAPAILDGGHQWKQVIAGWTHACGITTSGGAYCWGDNFRGQLGLGYADTVAVRSPQPVVGGLQFIQLSLGVTYSCGITVAHQAYCWGENFTGQLGDGTTTRRSVPTAVATSKRFSFIASGTGFGGGLTLPVGTPQGGAGHVCALAEDGQAWCWGWNAGGQLGNGTLVNSLTPVAVSGGLRFDRLSSGGAGTCGRKGNRIWCWGGDTWGQIGDGLPLATVNVPTLVLSPFNVP
jgi:alpha-tubulin suppressor-like RCC1 family protein